MSVEQKILILRKRIKDLNLKPTGYNKHGQFHYYQLSDFLPHTIDICSEIGLYEEYTEDEDYKTLVVKDVEQPTEARIFKMKLTEPDFTEIMAERNALIQAIQQNLPPQHIQSILSKKNKFRLEDLTNEELRDVWQWILNQRQAQQHQQQEEVEGEQKNDK